MATFIQGTGQVYAPTPDTPVEIQSVTGLQNVNVCGKNLFDINGTVTQGTLDKYNNGFTLIKGTNRRIRFVLPKVLPAGTYTLSYDVINSVHSATGNYFFVSCQYGIYNTGVLNNVIINDSGATFTTTSEFDRLYIFIADNQDDTATITIDNVQLEKGSTATTYEPYKGNTYEVNLGKNLFDKDNANILNAYINSNGNSSDYKKIISNNNSRTIYISCKSNTTYTVSKIAGQRFVVASCNNVPEANVLCTDEVHDQTGVSLTITTGANDKYLVVFYYLSTADTSTEEQIRNSIQIEVGNQATSYSPYFTPIELNKIGDYQDRIYKDNGKWYVEKNTRKLELAIADMNNNENYPGWIAYDEIKQLRKDVYNGIIANALGFYTNYYTNIATNNSWVSVNFNSANEPTLYLGRGYWGSDHTQTYWKTNW